MLHKVLYISKRNNLQAHSILTEENHVMTFISKKFSLSQCIFNDVLKNKMICQFIHVFYRFNTTVGYWHQVRSFGYMNSAVSIWFSFFNKFDNTGCKDKIWDFTPMNEVDIIWRYSGKPLYSSFAIHYISSRNIASHYMSPCHITNKATKVQTNTNILWLP